ncbi:MAG: YdcF family protein [Lachnospiraceae bacterium]|nr:YdcF family protein [Lachnospiraceae bacterium]
MAFASIAYFLVILLYSGITTDFCGIWPVISAVFALMGFFVRHERKHRDMMPKRLPIFIYTTFAICITISTMIMFLVLKNSGSRENVNCDYCIVLGSRVYDDGISTTLKKRLDKAAGYAEENPETILVLTGGMESSDPVPEALAMYNYLSMKGIPDSRMIIEAKALSTSENMEFSILAIENDLKKRMIPPPIMIGVVTSDYHMYRTLKAAENIYSDKIYGMPADSDHVLFLHMCVRECCAVFRDFLIGKI